jgi:hypothetical protein
VWPALLEWVSSLEDAYETLDRSGTDDNCRDQISFELISADGEVKARLTEVLANISIPKLHEMLAELEPLTCKGLKETE